MLTSYITRHGETEWNVEKKMQGWQDSPLTPAGITSALSLGKRLESVELDAVYTSPSGRARHTADLIRGIRSTDLNIDENLKEIHMGEWEGKTLDVIKKHEAASFYTFWNKPDKFIPSGGESFSEVIERAEKVLEEIKKRYPSGNVLIVTHSIVIKCLFIIFHKTSIKDLWAPPYIEDTSLSIVEMNSEYFQIQLAGCIAHKYIEKETNNFYRGVE